MRPTRRRHTRDPPRTPAKIGAVAAPRSNNRRGVGAGGSSCASDSGFSNAAEAVPRCAITFATEQLIANEMIDTETRDRSRGTSPHSRKRGRADDAAVYTNMRCRNRRRRRAKDYPGMHRFARPRGVVGRPSAGSMLQIRAHWPFDIDQGARRNPAPDYRAVDTRLHRVRFEVAPRALKTRSGMLSRRPQRPS